MNINLLAYCCQFLNMQIERQNALKAQEYLYMAMNQSVNQLLAQSLLQNNVFRVPDISDAMQVISKINNINENNFAKNNFNYAENYVENSKIVQSNFSVKEKISTESLTKISNNNNTEDSPTNTNFDSKVGKGFSCGFEGCGKKFEYKWILDRHVNSHFCFKMYKCELTGCEKAYKSKENLNLHVKNKHLGVKPYGCKFCPARFSHRNGKTYHERKVHLKILPFKCDNFNCDMAFASKSALRYHITHQH